MTVPVYVSFSAEVNQQTTEACFGSLANVSKMWTDWREVGAEFAILPPLGRPPRDQETLG